MGKLNIIVHGLLFLELKSNSVLAITAPQLDKHNLLMGTPGNLQNINNQEIHWESIPGVTPGTPATPFIEGIPQDVPSTLFKFNRNTTDVGNINLAGDQGKIFLPWPNSWDTIRRGGRPKLTSRLLGTKDPKKQVRTHIERLCSTQIGVATVLTYDFTVSLPSIPNWSPTVNVEIYFQPDNPEKVSEVNDDLATASKKLFSSDSFDLKIDEKDGGLSASTPIGQTKYPEHSGLSVTDELSLNEKIMLINPFDLSNPLRKCLVSLQSFLLQQVTVQGQTVKHPSEQNSDAELERYSLMMMASPANCPMFFLGG
jgi:hypothetical protein